MHTPGPWKAMPHELPQWKICGPDGEFDFVAITIQGNDEANAHLLAAALKLLEACKRLEWSDWADFQRSGRRPRCPACKGLQNDMEIDEVQAFKGGHVPNCWLAAAIAKAEKAKAEKGGE